MRIVSALQAFKITSSLQATGDTSTGGASAAAMPTDCCLVTSNQGPGIGGVVLPSDAEAGEVFFVASAYNSGAATVYVYPPSGGNFVGLPANQGFELQFGQAILCICFGSGVFLAVPFANSSY